MTLYLSCQFIEMLIIVHCTYACLDAGLNILVDGSLNPMLCDFGFAKVRLRVGSQSLFRSRVGSPLWMPIEIVQGRPYKPDKADVRNCCTSQDL